MNAIGHWFRAPTDGWLVDFFVPALLVLACAGCDGDRDAIEKVLDITGEEDSTITVPLGVTHAGKDRRDYRILSAPHHGIATLDASAGVILYAPAANFNGSDSFAYETVERVRRAPIRTLARVTVIPMNDAPSIESLPDVRNSAYEKGARVPIAFSDIDGDETSLSVVIDDPRVAHATVDKDNPAIVLIPIAIGETSVKVTVADSQLTAESQFLFTVDEVTRVERVTVDPSRQALAIDNTSRDQVEFSLGHNGFRSFGSLVEIVEYVRRMPVLYDNEPFERKLWRFLRDHTLHDYPLTKELWIYDPRITLDSLGWGLCSSVAAAFAQIAAAAGYESRVWDLAGHVVAEVFVDGAWAMYDPDLAVYYHKVDGGVAGVEDLVANASLLTSPVTPVFPPTAYRAPYTAQLAAIYTSYENNRVMDVYLRANGRFDGRVRLPPGGTLTYPGQWTEAPVGHDGATSAQVQHFLQALLTVPDGYSGLLQLPWLLHDIQGSGIIRIDGLDYEVRTDALAARLGKMKQPVGHLEVLHSAGALRFVMFVNVVGFRARHENIMELTGIDTAALSVRVVDLMDNEVVRLEITSALKPRPSEP